MRKQLYDCTTAHPDCVQSDTSGNDPRLPTRVLYVNTTRSYHDFVRVVETNGTTGKYCALSHCWGPVDRQPIRTTKENIQDHILGIPFEALPRTFREAVILTRSLGIEYLWIDSLCILQNDEDDWAHEAASMGDLYRQATLVIAAAGSEDSGGGLFNCERIPKIALQLPYAGKTDQDSGSFNVALQTAAMSGRNKGPLEARAWAFQEWYLARRIVFFMPEGFDMPGGVSWRCDTLERDENGYPQDLESYQHLGWLFLLSCYSEKKLTHQSDRLFALHGVVNEYGKEGHDKFLSEGVWEMEIAHDLLWLRQSVLIHDTPSLPSWSWASTEGTKEWVGGIPDEPDLIFDCVEIQRPQPGCLSVSGDIVKASTVRWTEMNECCVSTFACKRPDPYFPPSNLFQRQLDVLPRFDYKKGEPQTILLQRDGGILGFAVMDQEDRFCNSTTYKTLECCILGEAWGGEDDPDISKISDASGRLLSVSTGLCCRDASLPIQCQNAIRKQHVL